MQDVAAETVGIVFPSLSDGESLVRRHAWHDARYVGRSAGKVVTWRGWSVNLSEVEPRYRNIYIDKVDNTLPVSERFRLFGEDFAEAIQGFAQFITLFVTALPADSGDEIRARGFVPRMLTTVAHGCIVTDIASFLEGTVSEWAEQLSRLVLLQRLISVSRAPAPRTRQIAHDIIYLPELREGTRLVAEGSGSPIPLYTFAKPFPAELPKPLSVLLGELELLEDWV